MRTTRGSTTQRRRWWMFALVTALAMSAAACDSSTTTAGDDSTPAADNTVPADDSASDDMAEPSGPLIIAADTVSGPLNLPADGSGGAVCVLQSLFARNSEIVWRARVMDGSGTALSDAELASVVVELADGQTFDMRYGDHPRDNPTDQFWTGSFDIPQDYPTGTLDYKIVATATDGRIGEYTPFNVAPSLLTITDGVLETIEEEEG